MPRASTLAPLAGLALAAVVLPFPGDGAAQAIYRCDDGKGGVLYADSPCRGGTVLDLLPGKADPAAIERLRLDQKAFDERQAARDARAQAEAQAARESRRAKAGQAVESEASSAAAYPGYAWGGYWPYVPVTPLPRPRRDRRDRTGAAGVVRARNAAAVDERAATRPPLPRR